MGFKAEIGTRQVHAAIRVRDLEATLRFYHEVVGLPIERVRGDPARPEMVWLPGLQLIRDETLDPRAKGVYDHVGIPVRNLEAIVANLEANGVELETPITDHSASVGEPLRGVFFRDNEHNRVELLQWG